MIRVVVVVAAIFSPFLFPYPATLLFSFAASLYFPLAGVLLGVLTDLLYYVPGASAFSLPVGTISGALISGGALLVRRFVKARIIGG
mgnify:CR=1 FL=1